MSAGRCVRWWPGEPAVWWCAVPWWGVVALWAGVCCWCCVGVRLWRWWWWLGVESNSTVVLGKRALEPTDERHLCGPGALPPPSGGLPGEVRRALLHPERGVGCPLRCQHCGCAWRPHPRVGEHRPPVRPAVRILEVDRCDDRGVLLLRVLLLRGSGLCLQSGHLAWYWRCCGGAARTLILAPVSAGDWPLLRASHCGGWCRCRACLAGWCCGAGPRPRSRGCGGACVCGGACGCSLSC